MARSLDDLLKAQFGELMWQVLVLIQQNETLRESQPVKDPAKPETT